MANCKICKHHNPEKMRVFICMSCKEKLITCPNCKSKKSEKAKMCQTCTFASPEYRQKMSKACSGKENPFKGKKWTEAQKKKLAGRSPWNKGITLTKEQKKNYKGRRPWNKGITLTKEQKKNYKYKGTSEKTKEIIREKLLKRIERGEINGSPKCKIYTFNGITVQGRSELKWITENFYRVITDKKKAVKTPFGLYFPDFETKTAYIEIKSRYTYERMLDKADKPTSQHRKIVYVNKNIKPVKIYIDEGKTWTTI